MAVPPPQVEVSFIAEAWKGLAIFCAGLLLTLFGWLGQRHIKRIDDIANNYASKDDIRALHKRFDALMLELAHMRKDSNDAKRF